jgi:hypothetical protein
MFKWLKKLFGPKCDHNWVIEEPTARFGNSFMMWEGTIHDYCTKCGASRIHQD